MRSICLSPMGIDPIAGSSVDGTIDDAGIDLNTLFVGGNLGTLI